jgi:hypothetical protein
MDGEEADEAVAQELGIGQRSGALTERADGRTPWEDSRTCPGGPGPCRRVAFSASPARSFPVLLIDTDPGIGRLSAPFPPARSNQRMHLTDLTS